MKSEAFWPEIDIGNQILRNDKDGAGIQFDNSNDNLPKNNVKIILKFFLNLITTFRS